MRKKIKVLFVTPNLNISGTNSSLSSIINFTYLDQIDFKVFALAHEGRRYETFKDKLIEENELTAAFYCQFSKIQGVRRVLYFNIKVIKRICKILNIDLEKWICRKSISIIEKQYKYDYIVAFQEGYPTKFVSYSNNINKIAWVHCDYNQYLPKTRDEMNLYDLYKNIVCVSEYTASVFCHRYPALSNRISSIYNILDEENIKKLSLEPINDLKYNNNLFTIISLGRVSPVKRFDFIPQIAKKIIENGCNFKWYIIGSGNRENVELLKRNIEKYEVCEYVIYLGSKSNPYPFFINSDLLVSTSSSEACPMIFIEAKILQLPIVTSDFGSAKEFINQDINGVISSIDEIHIKIQQMINDNDKYNKIKSYLKSNKNNNYDTLQKIKNLFDN